MLNKIGYELIIKMGLNIRQKSDQLQEGAAKLESQNHFIQGRTGKYEIVPVLILTLVTMAPSI